MNTENGFIVRPGLVIPKRETWYEFSHASGPGGQNVNKVATAASLCFHPDSSGVLSSQQKALLHARLGRRINADGVLRITSDEARTQTGNRAAAAARFCSLLDEALKTARPRRPTRPSRASAERRLAGKRIQAARKAARRCGGYGGVED